jgi:hypothetical protein
MGVIMTDKMRLFAEELAQLLEKHNAYLFSESKTQLCIGDESLEIGEFVDEVDIRNHI